MGAEATLKLLLLGEDRTAGRALKGVGDQAEKTHSKLAKVSNLAGKALAGGLLIAGAAAVRFAKGAADDEAAASKLAQTMQKAAGATKTQVKATEDWITAQGKAYGVTDDDLRPALSKLVVATHDVGKAQKLASLAMDVSAGTGKDLGAVSMALAKAQNGNTQGLARLGVATKDADGKTKSLHQITKDLAATYGGAAAKNAETTAGKQKILTTQLSEAGETIGYKLLPFMLKLVTALTNTLDWMTRNGKTVAILAAGIGGLVTVVWAVNAAARAYAATQAALNIVMAANPLGAVILGAAALTAGLVWLTTRTKQAGDAVKYTLPQYKEYMQTLDGVTAATSRATREMVLERLTKSGLLEDTQKLNIADRDAVQAAMGNEAARKRVVVALRQAIAEGHNYQAMKVAERLNIETGAINQSRVAQLQKNLALAATKEEAQRIQAKLDKLAKTNANPTLRIDGASTAISQLNAVLQLMHEIKSAKGGNAQLPRPGSVLGQLSAGGSATGARFLSGGAQMVGERGPEIAWFPRGTSISTAADSSRMLSGGGGGDLGTLTVVVQTDTGQIIEQKLAKLKRTRGGASLAFA